MDKFEQAQAELEHRQRQAMVDEARRRGLTREVTYLDEVDGVPSAIIGPFEVGACMVGDLAPDHAEDN